MASGLGGARKVSESEPRFRTGHRLVSLHLIGVANAFKRHRSGPVISPAAKSRIESLIASATEQGGKIVLDGRGLEVEGYPDGNWIGPTVIEATTEMRCYRLAISLRSQCTER